MRKVAIIIITVILLIGVSGCKSVPAANKEINLIDAANASNIATAVSAYNALSLSSVRPISNVTTFEDAKKAVGKVLWPAGLSDEEERAAWKLIEIKDGVADLVLEAQEAFQIAAMYADEIANAINVHKVLNPSWPYSAVYYDNITLEYIKENIPEDYWPSGLSDEEERAALELIVYEDCVAELTPAAQEALQGETRYQSDRVKIAIAKIIAADINYHNTWYPNDMLPDDVTLAEVKDALGEVFCLSFLTDAEAEDAWKLIVIKDGVADLTPEAKKMW